MVKDLIFIENMRFFGQCPQNDNVESYFVINMCDRRKQENLCSKLRMTSDNRREV